LACKKRNDWDRAVFAQKRPRNGVKLSPPPPPSKKALRELREGENK